MGWRDRNGSHNWGLPRKGQASPWCGQGDPSSFPLRVCSVRSVDGSPTTAFTVLECEGSRRLGSRPRRYLLTGQANGSLAMWDLTTAMDGLGQAPGTTHPTSILSQATQTHPERFSPTSCLIISLPTPLPSGPFLPPPPNSSLPLLFNPSVSDPCPLTSASFLLSQPQSLHMTFVPCPVILVLPPDLASLPPSRWPDRGRADGTAGAV